MCSENYYSLLCVGQDNDLRLIEWVVHENWEQFYLKLETKQFYHHFPVNFVLINAKHCQLWLLFPKSQRKVYIFVKENKIQLFVMGVWELVGELGPGAGITATCGAEAVLGCSRCLLQCFITSQKPEFKRKRSQKLNSKNKAKKKFECCMT